MSLSTTAAARQKEINASIAVEATSTRCAPFTTAARLPGSFAICGTQFHDETCRVRLDFTTGNPTNGTTFRATVDHGSRRPEVCDILPDGVRLNATHSKPESSRATNENVIKIA